MDRLKVYDHTVGVLVPAVGLIDRKRFCFEDLLQIIEILRGENGCPWDKAQTHESLRTCLIEEAWETVAAIDEHDPDHLAEELGDVLLQVVFHSSIGQSHGDFTVLDVMSGICQKMIERHGHIFGDAQCSTEQEVNDRWEEQKRRSRGQETETDVLRGVTKGLPSLTRAAKVQRKAETVGFTLPDGAEAEDVDRRLGEQLFRLADACRRAGQDPELLLEQTTERFIERFGAMEKQIISDGKALQDLTLAEMHVYWYGVKNQ